MAHSKEEGKAKKALAILEEMKGIPGARPNSFTYNAVLSAAAFTVGDVAARQEALRIAITVFEEALQQATPKDRTNITYGLFFTACGNLAFDNRRRVSKLVAEVFSRCCRDGQVDKKVLIQIRKAATPDLMKNMFGDLTDGTSIIYLQDCPPAWSMNGINQTYRRKNH